jgi:hypothetical protein
MLGLKHNTHMRINPSNLNSKEKQIVISGKPVFGKIDCYVVLLNKATRARPKILGRRKVKIGEKTFSMFRGKRQRTWKIDYDQLIEGTKSYLYFVELEKAISPLSFYEYPAEKYGDELDSRNAELMLYDGAVEVFQGRKGIPLLYLLIMGIGLVIGMVAVVVILQMYLGEARLADNLELQVKNLKEQLAILQGASIP